MYTHRHLNLLNVFIFYSVINKLLSIITSVLKKLIKLYLNRNTWEDRNTTLILRRIPNCVLTVETQVDCNARNINIIREYSYNSYAT